MTVESLSICKAICKDCKNKLVPINFTPPDGYPVPAPEYDWKCRASPKGYRCTDGKPDGYDLCSIVNYKGDCKLFEPK